jgi:hypothetical protein
MKIHLETLDDFNNALNIALDAVKAMLTVDFTEEEQEQYLYGEYDDVILTLTTLRMKQDYTFSQVIIDKVGQDDDLFQ